MIEKPHRWDHEKLLTIFTGLLVLVGFAYSVTSVFQWLSMREQARAMAQQLQVMNSEIENAKVARSADFTLRFDERFARTPFPQIRSTIESNKPILKSHGGRFDEIDLDGYLDILDSLNDIYAKGIISDDAFYNAYSYDVEKAYDNVEVQNYLKNIRKEDLNFYVEFEDLALKMKAKAAATRPTVKP